jgi:UDP-N-acetylmuramoyl-tripeptide--D-alanyl-D-alanine ligase
MKNFVEYLYSKFLQSDGVSIDSRTIVPGNIFFGINGPNFKGSKYAKQALDNGASFAIVDDKALADHNRIIHCEDTQRALQDLARFHRSRFKRPVFGITGSNGKTTTKELIARVLDTQYVIHATKGNLNNHLGVPLTLLGIYPQVEIAIVEMGASHVGEIRELCELTDPSHGLITNIGRAHTESFGGIEGVIRGKSELFDHLNKHEGLPFINSQDPIFDNMSKRFNEKINYPPGDLRFVSATPLIIYSLNGQNHQTSIVGDYNFINIAAAIAVGRHFEVSDERIASAINTYNANNGRSQLVKKGSNQIIVDAYNANPDSMKVALENLRGFEGEKIAILGDMNELADAALAHKEIVGLAKDAGVDQLLLVGEFMKTAQFSYPTSKWFESVKALATYIVQRKFRNATILLKASRSIKLEEVVNSFED